MYSQLTNTQSSIPKAYNCRTLEGNWYEDRCTSNFDEKHKKNYSLKNPNEWLFQTTSNTVGGFCNHYGSLQNKFSQSNDNYINFQKKKHDMFVSVYKKSYDDKYLTINQSKNYYTNKLSDLETYRQNWTKREHLFETTYKSDLLKTFYTSK